MGGYVLSLIDHKIRVVLITGKKITISPKEVWQLFFDVDSATFFAASFCLVVFLFPVEYQHEIPWWMKLSAFSFYVGMIPVLYFSQVLALTLISMYLPRLCFFEPFILLVVAFTLEVIDRTVSPALLGEAWMRWVESASFGEQVVGTFILLIALDVLFSYFVLPQKLQATTEGFRGSMIEPDFARPERIPTAAKSSPAITEQDMDSNYGETSQPLVSECNLAPDEFVELDGQKIRLSSILSVEAEEHYVRVWTEDRELYFRHSFSGLIALLESSGGLIVRRGVWFSLKNIESIQKNESGKFVIIPFKGPTAIVPKAKSREVRLLLKKPPRDVVFEV